MRMLLIEDEENARIGLIAVLKLRGHIIDFAENAEKAVELLVANAYDLLLLDIMIPGGEMFQGVGYREMGKELLRRLRSGEISPCNTSLRVPAIAITGVAELDTYETLKALGILYMFQKPIDPEEAFDLIETICKSTKEEDKDE